MKCLVYTLGLKKEILGETFEVIQEPNNPHDDHAVRVMIEGAKVAYIMADREKVPNQFGLAKAVFARLDKKIGNAKILELFEEKGSSKKYVAEVIFEEAVASDEYIVYGQMSVYGEPRRTSLLDISTGSTLRLHVAEIQENEVILANKNNEFIGHIKKEDLTDEILEKFAEDLKLGKEIVFLASKLKNRGTIIVSPEKPFKMVSAAKFENVFSKLRGTNLSEEEAQERFDYLLDNGVSENLILSTLLKVKEKYPDALAVLIPDKPEIPFKDFDKILKKVLVSMNMGQNLSFEGEKSTGKNVLARTLAWLYKRPIFEFSMNSGLSNIELLGGRTVIDGNVVFEPSVIVQAAEHGGILVMDELNVALPAMLSLFNSLLDGRRSIDVPGYGFIKAHANFTAIATMNPGYVGTFTQNDATKDRFSIIKFGKLKDIRSILSASAEVDDNFLDRAQALHEKMVEAIELGVLSPSSISLRAFERAAQYYSTGEFQIEESLVFGVAESQTSEENEALVKSFIQNEG